MALELLYGPVNVAYNGTQVSTFGGGLGAAFVQGLGLIGFMTPTGGAPGTYVVQLDGTVAPRSNYTGAGADIIPDLRRDRGFAAEISLNRFQDFNYLACNPELTQWLTPPSGSFGTVHTIAPDRFLQFSNTHVNYSALDDAQTFTSEYTFTGTNPGAVASISVAGPTELCIAYGTGVTPQIRFYDWVRKTQSRPTMFVSETHAGVWYVPKWDFFIELKSRQLKILANAIHPATISNPAFSPSPIAGQTSDVSVQVLGAQSEPCVGELVNWSITSGGGSLSVTQSATDANGFAHTTYIAPTTLVGSVTIGADLEF